VNLYPRAGHALILAAVLTVLPGCNRNCADGHYETRHVSADISLVPVNVTGTWVVVPIDSPAHDRQVWVCDLHGEDEKDRPLSWPPTVGLIGLCAIPAVLILAILYEGPCQATSDIIRRESM
jgi:hypothetical protein